MIPIRSIARSDAAQASLLKAHQVGPLLRIGLDVVLAAVALLMLAPLLMVVAALLRLESPGPVLFCQRRTGLNGAVFRIYKFRTMTVSEDGAFVRQASPNDSRVTKLGSFLRSSSIDEMPQLLNVLRGEMSFIGPRPHAIAHDKYYTAQIPDYRNRFAVRPGITGWAQINGSRGATPTISDMQRRVELDLWYVSNRTMILDLRIIVATAVTIAAFRSSAY